MDAFAERVKQTSSWKGVGLAIVILSIILGIVIAVRVGYNYSNRAVEQNIKRIEAEQKVALEKRWMGITQNKSGLATVFSTIPEDQRILINANVFSTRLTGYLGPFNNGVFSEDTGVQIALASGSRCLVLEIDYEDGKYNPKLLYRDGWGMKRSLNYGDINKVAKSIAGRAFNAQNDGVPPQLAKDPLIVVLYFVRTPNQSREPKEYIRFLGAVAEALEPINKFLLGQTPQGDFRRQSLESQLFYTPYTVFTNRILLLTNVDTTGFRRLAALGLAGDIESHQDLDFMVHCRLYGKESPTPFGASSTIPDNSSTKPAAIITTPNYWLMTPPDREKDAFQMTKQAWSLTMMPTTTATNTPKADNIERLYKNYGVQSYPISLFDTPDITDIWTGSGKLFEKKAWEVKPELLRYIPAKPINILKPYPEANSDGGKIISPKL